MSRPALPVVLIPLSPSDGSIGAPIVTHRRASSVTGARRVARDLGYRCVVKGGTAGKADLDGVACLCVTVA